MRRTGPKGCYFRDGLDKAPLRPFEVLPPLARAIGWLILTHHRLPVVPVYDNREVQQSLGTRSKAFNLQWFESPLSLIEHDWNEINTPTEQAVIVPYWKFASGLPVSQSEWKAQAAKLACHLLEIQSQHLSNWIDNPYVMHLARLSLMFADHCYSSLPLDSTRRVRNTGRHTLFANTDSDGLKQTLDDHLLGVAREAAHFTHALPSLEHSLPRLAAHHELNRCSANPQFSWQDKAADAAACLRERASTHGAFIINMASTGCGKTLANARILYSLANPKRGFRAIYAIGLRALTLQFGS